MRSVCVPAEVGGWPSTSGRAAWSRTESAAAARASGIRAKAPRPRAGGRDSWPNGEPPLTWSGRWSRRDVGSPGLARVRVVGGGWALPALECSSVRFREQAAVAAGDGPSCIFVGPLEKAEKARLEALYEQARDSYYNGSPLVVDDMFDKVETRLRWHGSKLVLKYPRCSLKRFSAYADAEELLSGLGGMGKQLDAGQMMALASVWSAILATGLVVAAFPSLCAIIRAAQKAIHLHVDSHEPTHLLERAMAINGSLAIGVGLVVGVPIALAAASSLQGLWRGDLVALKGFCPSCGEEVYAFVKADVPEVLQHKTECHVCDHSLVFRASVERSDEAPRKVWAYGRVYLVTQSADLAPTKQGSSTK